MYEFKIGDEVKVVRKDTYKKGTRFIVTNISTNGLSDETLIYGSHNDGWYPSSLKLVCPAGYRPVREDEMDESPKRGDAWIDAGGLWVVNAAAFETTFGEYAGDGEPWFRPLTTEPVKIEPTVEEAPVVKEDNNWGWVCKGASTINGYGMSKDNAESAAHSYSRREHRDTLVFKVMGEYSTICTTKRTPTDE